MGDMRLAPLFKRMKIETKAGAVVPFVPNAAQKRFIATVENSYNNNKPIRVQILKARQTGFSTATEATLFTWTQVFDRVRALIIAHEMDSSEHLLGMTNLFWDSSPFRRIYTLKYRSRKYLQWIETGSSIRITTAKNKATGRSKTIHALHASEVAFWDDAQTSMLALRQSIPELPGTIIVLESTANGIGNFFYNNWEAAVNGDNDYIPLFFAWWEHDEYTASRYNLPIHNLGPLNEEERILNKMLTRKGLPDVEGRLVWRRWAIRNLCNNDIQQFHQEYPSTPDEAFISTGTNVFPIAKLKKAFDPIEPATGRVAWEDGQVIFQNDPDGPLKIYCYPSRNKDWGKYFVAGDPTHTTTHDWACIQVINRRTYEQVATWRGRIDPLSFADQINMLGRFYNDAIATTEITGPGYGTIGRLVEMDYPYLWQNRYAEKDPGTIQDAYGWQSTVRRKEWAVGHLLKLLVDNDITIHDATTYKEMKNFIKQPNGDYGNVEGEGKGHDDTVMALAIATICNATEGKLPSYGAEPTILDIYHGDDYTQQLNPAWSA